MYGSSGKEPGLESDYVVKIPCQTLQCNISTFVLSSMYLQFFICKNEINVFFLFIHNYTMLWRVYICMFVGVYIFMALNMKDHVLKYGALMQYLEVKLFGNNFFKNSLT